jgi:hypothetical protein
MRTRFCENYFLGKGFGKTSADFCLNSDVASGGGGVWGGILRLLRCFLLANWGRALIKLKTIKNLHQKSSLQESPDDLTTH